MSNFIKDTLNRIFPGRPAYKTLIHNKKSFLYSLGWIESKKRNYPCEKDGTELPWMNYSIISFLKERLKDHHSLFEFGSGFSTTFYAGKVNNVTSVEHDKNWYDNVKSRIPNNAELIFTKDDVDGDYCRSIQKLNRKFHIIVIDGKDRVNCIKQSVECLTNDGIILLDDSHRTEYNDAHEFLSEKGFRKLNFEGLKPAGNGMLDYSTLFYKQDNCFNI